MGDDLPTLLVKASKNAENKSSIDYFGVTDNEKLQELLLETYLQHGALESAQKAKVEKGF